MRLINYNPYFWAKQPNFYGDASDGDVVLIANTTLTRDMYYRNLTIDFGVILQTMNFRVFVQGVLVNRGIIECNGVNAALNFGGVAWPFGTLAQGQNGVDGVVGPALGLSAGTYSQCHSGDGGNGGDGPVNAGGLGSVSVPLVPGEGDIFDLLSNLLGSNVVTWGVIPMNGGPAGGSGGADIATATSGGSGSGGGVILIVARYLNNAAGLISAFGGMGGNAAGVGDAGGGGGGSGGLIQLAYDTIIPGIILATGGAGGLGIGLGVNGFPGGDGYIYQFPINLP